MIQGRLPFGKQKNMKMLKCKDVANFFLLNNY